MIVVCRRHNKAKMRTLSGFDEFVDAADFPSKLFMNSGSSSLGVISFPNWAKFLEFLKIKLSVNAILKNEFRNTLLK